MRIGIDAEDAAKAHAGAMPTPIQIKPPRICINFDGDAVLGACCQNLLNIDLVSGPPQQLPAGHVTQDRRMRIGYGTDDPLRLS